MIDLNLFSMFTYTIYYGLFDYTENSVSSF